MRTLRVVLAAGAVTAVLLPGGSAQAQDVCVTITVTTFATAPITTGPTCMTSPFVTTYTERTLGVSPWVDVTIELMAPDVSTL